MHVEMSPMAALHFESGRQSNISVQVNRLLEKCLKESKCVDLEALCIVAEEKVSIMFVNFPKLCLLRAEVHEEEDNCSVVYYVLLNALIL